MPRLSTLLFACLLACATIMPAHAAPQAVPSATSKTTAPTIRPISTQDILKLVRDNKGKAIFINFFASWCPPCREEIPELISLRRHYKEDQLLIIGVSLDNELNKLDKFAARMGFNYPIYQAMPDVGIGFRISSIPHNVVYSPDGTMVVSEAGMVTEADLKNFFDELLK